MGQTFECMQDTRAKIHTPYEKATIPPPPPGLWDRTERGGSVLFIIDPQNDFHPGGSLAIPTADEDAQRIARFIEHSGVDEIVVAMDTHQRMHIAHGIYWKDREGRHPDPFTEITAQEVETGRWHTVVPEFQKPALEYCRMLEAGGRFKLCIWPEHCIKGTPGHNVTPPVMHALNTWAQQTRRIVRWLDKGENIFTEMYSALRAEVPTEDPRTHLNFQAIRFIKGFDRIFVCGQAMSHCVACSVKDLIADWDGGFEKVTLLTDAASPVPGAEEHAEKFLADIRALGVKTRTVADVLQDMGQNGAVAPQPVVPDDPSAETPEAPQ